MYAYSTVGLLRFLCLHVSGVDVAVAPSRDWDFLSISGIIIDSLRIVFVLRLE